MTKMRGKKESKQLDQEEKEKNTIEFLEEVYSVFKDFTGNELETMTRKELPWTNARGNLDPWEPGTTIISNEDMYKQCALLSNTKGEYKK